MTLKQPLTLEVYLHDEECERAADAGVHMPLSEHSTTETVVLAVSSLSPYYDKDSKRTIAMVNCYGDTFHTVRKYKEIKELIFANLVLPVL